MSFKSLSCLIFRYVATLGRTQPTLLVTLLLKPNSYFTAHFTAGLQLKQALAEEQQVAEEVDRIKRCVLRGLVSAVACFSSALSLSLSLGLVSAMACVFPSRTFSRYHRVCMLVA